MNLQLSHSELNRLIEAGSTAPSGGNAQPWLVDATPSALLLRLDPLRSESILDVASYASLFALGAFAENVLIAAEHLGLQASLSMLQHRSLSEPFAKISFTESKSEKVVGHTLYPFLTQRGTNRNYFDGTIIEEPIMDDLRAALSILHEHFYLAAVRTNQRKETVSAILGKADQIRYTNPTLFKQMVAELRFNQEEVENTRDGIDFVTLELPRNAARMIGLLKQFPALIKVLPGKVFGDQAKPLLVGSSHLCCIHSSHQPSPATLFKAGQAAQRLWLTTTMHGLALHPWTVLTFFALRANHFPGSFFDRNEEAEINSLQTRLCQVLDIPAGNTPLFIFRLSRAKAASAQALRRAPKAFTRYHT